MNLITMKGLTKYYGDSLAVDSVDLEVAEGEFVVMVGPSGSGKSTLLRMVAGLEEIDRGELHINRMPANHLHPKERGMAMVFQNYALYPHMTVYGNMAFALKSHGFKREQIRKRVHSAAELLDLSPYLKRKPSQLSGGQRQRVAIGRAIVREAKILLFDEPLSNLDAKLRAQMRVELRRLHERIGATSLYVTHDQAEAMTLADRILVLNQGRVEQCGPPDTLYRHPASPFVAGFLGSPPMNLIPAHLLPEGLYAEGLLGFRPENIWLHPSRPDDICLETRLEFVERQGADKYLYLALASDAGSNSIIARLTQPTGGGLELQTGADLRIYVPQDDLCFFRA